MPTIFGILIPITIYPMAAGAIDGFSRKMLYIICANINKANTVVQMLLVHMVLPTKFAVTNVVNVGVLPQYGAFMCSSCHNVLIERLWGDAFRCVGQIFYEVLYGLEDEGLLDPLNYIDQFCVHFTLLPALNCCLAEFMDTWNVNIASQVRAT